MAEQTKNTPPKTVPEVVERLLSELPLKDKTMIARMDEKELIELEFSALGLYIRTTYGVSFDETKLSQSCRAASSKDIFQKKNAAAAVIKELWKKLRATHTLRVMK